MPRTATNGQPPGCPFGKATRDMLQLAVKILAVVLVVMLGGIGWAITSGDAARARAVAIGETARRDAKEASDQVGDELKELRKELADVGKGQVRLEEQIVALRTQLTSQVQGGTVR